MFLFSFRRDDIKGKWVFNLRVFRKEDGYLESGRTHNGGPIWARRTGFRKGLGGGNLGFGGIFCERRWGEVFPL